MTSIILSMVALAISVAAAVDTTRTWRHALNNLLWVELQCGVWER